MPWIPIGPDFVARYRQDNPKRLSRRNESGRNGWVGEIAIHPSDANVIYAVQRPSSGGSAAFRTTDGGRSWTSVSDSLQRVDPHVDPSFIAFNPSTPTTVYLATYNDQGFYVSTNGGDTWGPRVAVGGRVRRLVVDPATAADPATTHIYAATQQGLFRSTDGGAIWTNVLPVDCADLAAHLPAAGTKRLYVGAWKNGLHYSENGTAWTNLSTLGIGLPAFTAGNPTTPDSFTSMRVDYCRLNPARAYLWLVKPSAPGSTTYVTEGLYTTTSPQTAWTLVGTSAPPPQQGLYNFEFAVAPNSPGNGTADILFIGNVGFHRSTDGGSTWTASGLGFHADQQSFAFFPAAPPAGTIPVLYKGDDGGLSRATRLCDPAFAFATDPAQYNAGDAYTDTGWFENLNHARQDVALYQHASHSAVSALNYTGAQDTGVAGGPKALGWRSLADADAGAIAIAPGSDGLKVWGIWGAFNGFPSFRMTRWTDDGDQTPASNFVTVGAGGPLLNTTSNYELTPGNECLAGAVYRTANGTLSAAITADPAAQAATPTDMTGIVVGSVVIVAIAAGGEERVVVTAVTATTFSAVFTRDHAVGDTVQREDYRVVRASQAAVATPISTNFPWAGTRNLTVVKLVAPHPSNADVIACATGDNRVWLTTAGSTAGAATAWTEIATDRPTNPDVVALAVTVAGGIYALLRAPLAPPAGGAATPLYRLDGGSWVPQACTGNPANQGDRKYAMLVAHPGNDGDLFAVHGARVYRLVRQAVATGDEWAWTDVSTGLPGTWLYDLWAGWIGTAAATRQAVLRASGPTRGVWELLPDDMGQGAQAPLLYVRDHLLDQGVGPLETGAPNPYLPTQLVRHYHCADLKVEGIQDAATGPDYFQTEPEYTPLPIDHVAFDMLRDDRAQLGAGRAARVHVQVHNRSLVAAEQVRVWAIYANAAGGVPSLAKSASNGDAFPFWTQFTAAGQIVPALPADSPWTSVGAPVTLDGITPDRPRVASWPWTVPTLATGDPGHYCMVAFIHSAANPIGETSFVVDNIARTNRQIGQKNLQLVTLASGSPGGTAGGGEPAGAAPMQRRAYIEFHNPERGQQAAALEFDFTALPPEIEVTIQTTPLRPDGVEKTVTGAAVRQATREEMAELAPAPITVRRAPFLRRLLEALLRVLRRLLPWLHRRRPESKRPAPERVPLPAFGGLVYQARPGEVVRFPRVEIAPQGFEAAMLRIRHRGGLAPGSVHTFEVRQMAEGREKERELRGGSTYHVVIEGGWQVPARPDSPRDLEPPADKDRKEERRLDVPGRGDEEKYIPEAARHLVRDPGKESR